MYSNGKLNSYKELIVWQKSVDLVDEIYKITKALPKQEMFGLASQMQRAAVAIPSNIAEGYSRNHRGEFIQFLGIGFASGAELETQLIICKRQFPEIDYRNSVQNLIEVQKMLNVLIRKLKSQQ